MIMNKSSIRHTQLGLSGLLISAAIAGATMLTVAGVVVKANRDSYQTPNKVRIEVANQLIQSGLRHWSGLIRSEDRLKALLNKYENNDQVVFRCSSDTNLPESLTPQQTIDILETPNPTEIVHLKGVFAPYDCNKSIDIDNYRLTFEIHGHTHCNSAKERNAENCTVRSIAMNAYAGDEYNPKITIPSTKIQSNQNQANSNTSNKKSNSKPRNNIKNGRSENKEKGKQEANLASSTRRGRNVQ